MSKPLPGRVPGRVQSGVRPRMHVASGVLATTSALSFGVVLSLGASPARADEQGAGAGAPALQPTEAPSSQAPTTSSTAPSGGELTSDSGLERPSLFDEPARPLRKIGLMFDLGTLEGGMMSLVYRPVEWLRVHAGGGTNGAGPGVAAGAVVAPWRDLGWSLSVGGGHFFPGDVNGLFAAFAGSDYDDSHLLEHFDYDFVSLQLGWEYERGDLMFFARGGIGMLWTQLPSDNLSRIENLSSFVDPRDGSVQALLPSLSLGIIGFL